VIESAINISFLSYDVSLLNSSVSSVKASLLEVYSYLMY
jgi:hypothetical protein